MSELSPPQSRAAACRRVLTVLLAALASGVLLGLVSPAMAAAAPNTLFGFNNDNELSNYGLQPQLDMPVRRMLMGWNNVQPTQDTWNWSQYDGTYAQLLAHGLVPEIVVQSAPCWANTSIQCPNSAGAVPPDPAHYQAWGTFIAAIAARYPRAIGIEIWNEENLTYEWLPYPDPAAYTDVLTTAYHAVKAVDPSMPVISGGLFVSAGSGSYGMADAAFLSGMYAHGVMGQFDGIGIHPYPTVGGWDGTTERVDTNRMEQILDSLRSVRDAAGDHTTPLWITEMGVSTLSQGTNFPGATETEQAADLLQLLTRAGADADVRVALIHRLVDPANDPTDQYGGYGVFNPDGTPKLAACQLSLLFHGSLSCPGVTLMTSALYSPPHAAPPPAPVATTAAAHKPAPRPAHKPTRHRRPSKRKRKPPRRHPAHGAKSNAKKPGRRPARRPSKHARRHPVRRHSSRARAKHARLAQFSISIGSVVTDTLDEIEALVPSSLRSVV